MTKLEAEVRESRGKGPARRMRSEGKIPAVIYGPGIDSTALTLDPKELVKTLHGEKGRNSVFLVEFAGKSEHAMVRDVAINPVTRNAIHVDFLRIDENVAIDAHVPLSTKGRALGVQKGGKLTVKYRTLPVRCLPGLIPAKIELDVSAVDMGQSITVADIAMPEGVSITLKETLPVVGVFEEKAVVEEATDAAAAPAGKAAAKPAGKK